MKVVLGWMVAVVLALAPASAEAQAPEDGPLDPEVETADDGRASGEEATTEETAEAPEPEEVEEDVDPPHIQEAQGRIDRGVGLLGDGDYDAALAEFEEAYELVGDHPIRFQLLYNIGQAHELRFRYDLALSYYQRFLDEGGRETALRADVEAKMQTLRGLLATLVIASNVPAEVWVDDRHVGDAPGDVLVTGGLHIVELRAEGYTDARAEVQIAPRAEEALSFELEELAEEYAGVSPVFFWSSAGIAAASLVAGAVLGVVALSERGSLDGVLDDPVDRYDTRLLEDHRTRIQNLALAADVFFGAAVLFGATAVVVALFTDWGDEEGDEPSGEAASVQVGPLVGDGLGGAVVQGAF